MTRDLSEAAFKKAMEANGWKKQPYSFMGYWEHEATGLHVSELNYRTRRIALAEFIKAGERSLQRQAEARAAKEAKS